MLKTIFDMDRFIKSFIILILLILLVGMFYAPDMTKGLVKTVGYHSLNLVKSGTSKLNEKLDDNLGEGSILDKYKGDG